MRLILVRHGQSAANLDKRLHFTLADHAIPLSDLGMKQAREAGKFLSGFINDLNRNYLDYPETSSMHDQKIRTRLWLSPYERTRQTADQIMFGINETNEKNLAFTMDRRENIRLCEQQFGLFDGIPDNERHLHYPAEAEHYKKCEDQEGHFWARMPLGESRFDVANRVYQTFGTFNRDADRKHNSIKTIAVVCHGVTLRAIVMQWLHLTPEWFNAEPNPGNCDIRLIENNEDKGYIYRGIME